MRSDLLSPPADNAGFKPLHINHNQNTSPPKRRICHIRPRSTYSRPCEPKRNQNLPRYCLMPSHSPVREPVTTKSNAPNKTLTPSRWPRNFAKWSLPPERGSLVLMGECAERAMLIVTRAIEGTSTTIAHQRLPLICVLPQGHEGSHHDSEHGESWEAPPGRIATLLRHEEAKDCAT